MGRTIRGTRHCQPVDPYSKATAPTFEGNVLIRPLTSSTGRSVPAKKFKARKPVGPTKPRKVGLGAFGNDDDFLRIEKVAKKVSSGGTHASAPAPTQSHGPGGPLAATPCGKNALAASIEAVLNKRPAEVLEREDYERRVIQQKLSAAALRKAIRPQDKGDDSASDDDAGAGDEELLVTSLRKASLSNTASTSETSLAMLDIPLVAVPLSEYNLKPPACSADDDAMTVEPSGTSLSTSPNPSAQKFFVPPIFSTARPSDGMDVDTPTPPAPLVFPSWKPIVEPVPVSASLAEPSIKTLHHQATAAEAPAPNAAAVASRGRAAAITAGRTRKPKKKRRAELFDYLSDDSEDWDALPSAAPRRAKSGKALDGAEPYNAPGIVPPVAPELLPATRAAAEKLFPTNYQSALLQRAKDGNVICVLPTGSGKTLVAVLLIDWMYNQIELPRVEQGNKKRLQFFLTNSVPLVHQQANILAHNSSLRVGKLFGGLGVNLSSDEEWLFNFEHYDCLVLTAQLLLDSLAHGFISMSQISLMVFDEAHHAKSNHPFASILRDFYGRIPDGQDRPRILGLTASPLNSNEGLTEAEHLQALFDAKLVTAPEETLQELTEMVAKPTELTFKYKAAPHYPPTKLFTAIHEKVLVRDADFERFSRAAQIALAELGPDASDLVFHIALAKWAQKTGAVGATAASVPEVANKAMDPEFDLIHRPELEEGDTMDVVEEKPKEADDESARIPDWLREVQMHKSNPAMKNLSPKLQTLVKVLGAYSLASDTFCGIVFVNKRVDALLIAHLLRQFAKTLPELSWLRVRCVTGHGTSANKSLGPRMQWAEQAEVLTDFGEGNCNLLIATSVVEEGLDVQPCNFVARFNLYATHISMAQSRGRARRAGSHYVLFVQEGSYSDERKIARIREFDNKMAELLHDVDAQYDGDYGADEDLEPEAFYIEPTTNALLTPHFSVSLLYRYCQSLPQSDAYNSTIPRFEVFQHGPDSYTCSIHLPPSARIRAVCSKRCETPKTAKREASYMCCKLLRHAGALDDHLLPILTFATPKEVHDEQGRVIGSKKRQIGYEKKLADAWTVQVPFAGESNLYGTLLGYNGPGGTLKNHGDVYQPVVLLSRNPLPAVPPIKLFIEGEPVYCFATPVATPFMTSDAQRETLLGYTLRIFKSTLNRALDANVDDMLYFIAPLVGAVAPMSETITVADLDWAAMEYGAATQEEELRLGSLPDLTDRVIVDAGKNACRYFFTKTRPDLSPTSKLPPGRQSDAGYQTVIDYYLSFNQPLFHKQHIKDDQPLFEVTRMPKVVSYLTATPRNNVTPSPKKLLERAPRFAIPQLCSRHSIPSSLFRTYLMLPSIITEFDQLMLIQELNANVFNSDLDVGVMRAALTCPSACLEDSYERLELLGDAFLKYVSSVFVFCSLPKSAHEGEMHHVRLHHIQNATLFKAGLELNLPAYLVSRPFTSRLFVPPNFKLLRGQAPPHLASIGDKTIADVCEGLMGAAYETGFARGGLQEGFECALRAALALKVDLKGVTKWNDMRDMFGPVIETATIAEGPLVIEQKLHHRFKHAHLLTEALTHPSKLNATASFQRLEWLGDSILDFLVLGYCWNRWGGSLPPGHLTELKGAMVSNETLAALAVELELDRYLSYENTALTVSLETYRAKVTKAKETEIREAAEEARERRPYWLLQDAPKAVADIIESLYGAIFVDCGFLHEGPQASFDVLLAPFYAEWVSPTKLKIDAIRILLETAQAAACDDVSHISSTIDGRIAETGEVYPRMTKTSVIAHGEVLATVITANSKTAKRLVSANALQYLDSHPNFFARHCNCEQVRAVAREEAEELATRRRNEGLESEEDSESDDDDDDDESIAPVGDQMET